MNLKGNHSGWFVGVIPFLIFCLSHQDCGDPSARQDSGGHGKSEAGWLVCVLSGYPPPLFGGLKGTGQKWSNLQEDTPKMDCSTSHCVSLDLAKKVITFGVAMLEPSEMFHILKNMNPARLNGHFESLKG